MDISNGWQYLILGRIPDFDPLFQRNLCQKLALWVCNFNALQIGHQHIVQRHGGHEVTTEVQAQRVQFEFSNIHTGMGCKIQAEYSVVLKGCLHDAQWPKLSVPGCLETTGMARRCGRLKHGFAWHFQASHDFALCGIQPHLHHAHRW